MTALTFISTPKRMKLLSASLKKSVFFSIEVICAFGHTDSIAIAEMPTAVPISRIFFGFNAATKLKIKQSVSSSAVGILRLNASERNSCSSPHMSGRLKCEVLLFLSPFDVSKWA